MRPGITDATTHTAQHQPEGEFFGRKVAVTLRPFSPHTLGYRHGVSPRWASSVSNFSRVSLKASA